MTVVDVMRRVLREVPEGRVAGFLSVLNDCVTRLSEQYRWPYYVTELTLAYQLTFANLTVTNGATTATVVDGDAGGYFNALHAGKTMTIAGTSYTVSSVTDANTLVISTLSDDTGAGLSGTLPTVVQALPSTFHRMYGRPRRASSVNWNTYVPQYYLMDPWDYVLRGPSSGIWTIELQVALTEDYTVRYIRKPTAATGPGSTVDIDTGLERALFQGVKLAVLMMVEARNEIHLAQLQQRIRHAERDYVMAVQEAKAMAGSVDERVAMNTPWGFN